MSSLTAKVRSPQLDSSLSTPLTSKTPWQDVTKGNLKLPCRVPHKKGGGMRAWAWTISGFSLRRMSLSRARERIMFSHCAGSWARCSAGSPAAVTSGTYTPRWRRSPPHALWTCSSLDSSTIWVSAPPISSPMVAMKNLHGQLLLPGLSPPAGPYQC